MKIDQTKAKLYSTIGPRATLGMVLLDIIKENKNLMVLTSDVSTSAGLIDLENKTQKIILMWVSLNKI